VLVVRAEAPWKTWPEFVAAVRANPGKFTYGSSGNYGTMHVPMEMLLGAAGLRMIHVPYTGAGPAIVGLLGGQIDAVATGPATIVQHVNAGKLRALAQWGTVRLTALPDVPTLRELGVPVDYAQWSGLFVPTGTPEAIGGRLRDAARMAARDDRVRQVMVTAGSPIQYLDTPDFQRYVDADAARMIEVVQRIGKVE
jgi:tripartite-type tricarboxylate transporter receptor subunit TctC